MLNKVPEVTLWFWVIKVLSTTVGETAADFLTDKVGLGLTGTSLVMGALLVAVLVWQLRTRRYVPGVYWTTVVLVSIVGTLITDNLTDNIGVPLALTTTVFSLALAVTFGTWYARERTLSIHSIVTTPREAFYWLAILLTFALGTAGGDFLAEQLSFGYLVSLAIFAGAIALVLTAWRLGVNAVLTFWVAYVLTRPLGASLGDLLSQPHKDGGLGLGTTVTSVGFLAVILVVVTYLAVTRRDVDTSDVDDEPALGYDVSYDR
jgi:uncharacterized membrane-anchored protein